MFLLICIFSTILYHKIGKSAKAQVLPDKNLLHYAIGVFAFSIVMQVVNQLMSGLGFDITAYIFPLRLLLQLLAWVYVTYQKWEQEVAKKIKKRCDVRSLKTTVRRNETWIHKKLKNMQV